MKVHEIMTAHARCIRPDNTLVEAAGLMRELDVGALPVCDGDSLAGIVTDRDLVVRAMADGGDPNEVVVRDVMSQGVAFVLAEQDVEEAVRVMEQKQIRRVPVLNRQKRLVGIVALADIAMSSNPVFTGLALRDVSEPPNASSRQRHLQAISRSSGPNGHSLPGEEEAKAPTARRQRTTKPSTRRRGSSSRTKARHKTTRTPTRSRAKSR